MARKAWRGASDSIRRGRWGATRSHRMNTDRAICETMIAAIPRLRRFAVSLAGVQHADDLVQETLLLAWDKINLFDARGEMLPWLIAILRNRFYDQRRRRRKEIEDVDGAYAQALTTGPTQIARAEHADLCTTLLKLPKEMREALIAVGYSSLSYQEAAQACDCPVGTIGSRVHRAREYLGALLGIESPHPSMPTYDRVRAPQKEG
jgi:RNA polymerase sigma-70 factor, ECF subfamily